MYSPGAGHGKIGVGSTELFPLQRYRENTQKKKNSLFTEGALYRAPMGPKGSKVPQNLEYVPKFHTML